MRGVLKKAFPGIKFSVTSSTFSMGSSVHVSWSDGPLSSDVDSILNRFKSGSFDGRQDMYNITGYFWEGELYVGAKFIDSSREILQDRKAIIESKLAQNYESDIHGDYSVRTWEAAERELIQEGALQGHASQLPNDGPFSKVPALESVVETEVKNCKVIPFPIRTPEEQAQIKANKLMEALSPEQKLKIECLRVLMGQEIHVNLLIENPFSIDQLFRIAAEKIFC
ncbi:LPD29 domain-containing protein [Paenibacillus sp. FSL L8-0463]|uniref:LPD29 domain-containing protein n=1 Tax=Paenibacillus sp. FSL L8-0463 TaxID=2954687 RepID=UPI003119D3F8